MIKFNFRYFKNKISSFPKPINYDLIENEKVLETSVPIHLPNDLEKVKKSPFGISLDKEFKHFFETSYTSGPFYHYQLEDVFLLKNRIYFENFEYILNPHKKTTRFYNSKDILEFEQASFSSMRISTVFFGHWLREEMILIDYLQGNKNIVTSSPPTPQKREIIDLFELKCQLTQFARIKYADMYSGWQHSSIYIDILRKHKEKIALLAKGIATDKQRIVYLKRGRSAEKRALVNEATMLETLSKDFDIIALEAESTPIYQLYSVIYSADIILSIEGSQMAHAIIAGKQGATLICIQPPFRFYNPYKKYCSDANIRYAVFIGDQGVDEGSFNVDIERFKKLLEIL